MEGLPSVKHWTILCMFYLVFVTILRLQSLQPILPDEENKD